MNLLVLAEIKDAHAKMAGYTALLNYRYSNLCVKAEPASLLPVSVKSDLGIDNLEEVAAISSPDEYQLAVYPKHQQFLEPIIKGIFDVHPEFKMEMKVLESSGDEKIEYPLYTMPEVDKNRRDALNTAADSFYEEAKLRIDKVYTDFQLRLLDIAQKAKKEDIDEVKEELDKGYNEQKEAIAKIKEEKENEINEAYQRYLLNHRYGESNNEESNKDVTQTMLFGWEE